MKDCTNEDVKMAAALRDLAQYGFIFCGSKEQAENVHRNAPCEAEVFNHELHVVRVKNDDSQ